MSGTPDHGITIDVDAWLEAMRSGRYRRGTCRLWDREAARHCCLGVAADVHDPDAWDAGRWSFGGVRSAFRLPGVLVPDDLQVLLMRVNDAVCSEADEGYALQAGVVERWVGDAELRERVRERVRSGDHGYLGHDVVAGLYGPQEERGGADDV